MRRLAYLLSSFVVLAACAETSPSLTQPESERSVASVDVAPAIDTLTSLGDTLRFTAQAKDSTGATITGKTVAWSSSDTTVARIDSSTGLATAVGNGAVTLKATVDSIQGSAALTVAQEVTAVTVSPESATVSGYGSTHQFTARADDALGSEVAGVPFLWLSSNHNVAIVDTSGLATSTGEGVAIITAAAHGIPGNARLAVLIPVDSVIVEPDEVTMTEGDTLTLTVTTLDERGDPLTGRTVVWSSDNGAVASVDSSGLVAAIGEGTATITVTSESASASSNITVKPFVVPIATARGKSVGDTVRVEGIVLSNPNTFGDNTMHVSDTSAAIRGTGISASVSLGDSVRVAGLLGSVSGQPVIESAAVTKLGTSSVPNPQHISTGDAATATGGELDAALIRIDSARVTDTVTVNQDFVVTIDDGSGAVDVVLDNDVGFNQGLFAVPGLVPGTYLKVTGLLVPTGSGDWQLKPCSDTDLSLTVPVISIAEARDKPVGEIVFVDGVMLNDWSAFGDSTAHIADASGALRGIRVRPSFLVIGETVRFVGTMAVQNGQPVIADVAPFSLGGLNPPSPVPLATAEAATAQSGARDAALVTIQNCVISSTDASGADFLMTVDDGSGPVIVVLDKDIFVSFGAYTPGVIVTVTGLLVPSGSGTWVVKPRQQTDVIIITP